MKFVKLRNSQSSKFMTRVRSIRNTPFVADIVSAVTRLANNPGFVITLAAVTVFCFINGADWSTGPLADFIKAHPDNDLAKWVLRNGIKADALLTLIPLFFVLPNSMSFMVPGIGFLVYVFIPAVNLIYYFIMSMSAAMYFKVSVQTNKVLFIALIGLVLYFDIAKFGAYSHWEPYATTTSGANPPK